MFKYFIALIKWIIAYFVTLPERHRKDYSNLMIVSEMGNDARDNGYHFFLYVKNNHPEIDVRYIITDNSPDRGRLVKYESSLIKYLSFNHCCYFWRAHWIVGTHLRSGHTPFPFVVTKWLNRLFRDTLKINKGIYHGKVIASLEHGIIKNFIKRMTYKDTHYDMICCGAAGEAEFLVDKYGYPDTVALYTGLCRFDNLMTYSMKRQILVMPTWRSYIKVSELTGTRYYRAYEGLLGDSRLAALLDKYDIDLIFYPHHRFQPVVEQFSKSVSSPRITVADIAHYDVQELLKESSLLITDYSSVLFDFVYMKKPVLFYFFDRDDYLSKHFERGYVDEDSFGPVMKDVDSLLCKLSEYLDNGMVLEECFEANVDKYFPLRDTKNCERVYNAIMACV